MSPGASQGFWHTETASPRAGVRKTVNSHRSLNRGGCSCILSCYAIIWKRTDLQITIALEILPLGAVCIFAPSPTERVKETFSYFSPIPFGYANFAPLITAVLTVVILLLSLISLKKNGVFNSMFVLSIITAVISLLPLVYGLSYFTFVGALITMALVTECILIKTQQK